MEYFDYCVCYLDNQTNKAIAEKLIFEVSSYELPKKIRGTVGETGFNKGTILALSSDAPLSNEQMNSLYNCRWLMIICSKQDRNALSIGQAINFFIAQKGHSFILPILVNGDPQESFPSELLEERITRITFSDGATQEIKEIIEPLAIDIRAKDLKSSLAHLHHARIKTVAALIGVSYDTLEQRHDKRVRRRIRILASVIIAIPVILGCLFTYMWINSEQKIDIATKKTQISKDLLADMCKNYPILFKDIPQIEPFVNTLLVESIEKLRVVESEYIPLLSVDDLLLPNRDDDLGNSRNKAKIHRYLGNKTEALTAYKNTASLLEQGSEEYERISAMFVNNTDPKIYPNGILVVEIDEKNLDKNDSLKKGDLIVEIGGFKFRNQNQFDIYLENNSKSRTIKLTVLRPDGNEFILLSPNLKPSDIVFKSEEM